MADRATTGLLDGEGRMWGHWRIAGSPLTGRWMIAQRRDIALQDDRLTQIVDLNGR